MPESRRRILAGLFGAAGVLAVDPLLAGLQAPAPGSGSGPKAKVYPNGRDHGIPPNADDPGIPHKKVLDPQSQKQIREDIARLYEIASELKGEVERTDANATLSVSLVKKAQQIEKLARQIKELARG